jgi:hypothetical protein
LVEKWAVWKAAVKAVRMAETKAVRKVTHLAAPKACMSAA